MKVKEFFRITKEKLIVFVILAGINIFLTFEFMHAFYMGYAPFSFFFFKQVVLNINVIPLLVISVRFFILFSIVSLLYWYVISCCAVSLYKRFKKKPKVLAGIVLAVIVLIVVLAYLSASQIYVEQWPQRDILIVDAFCAGGDTANIVVRNIGTSNTSLSDIEIVDTSTNVLIANPNWTSIDGDHSITELSPGNVGKFSTTCDGYCRYRFIWGRALGGTQVISVAC